MTHFNNPVSLDVFSNNFSNSLYNYILKLTTNCSVSTDIKAKRYTVQMHIAAYNHTYK